MSIPYRTRRVLNRLGLVLMIFLLVGVSQLVLRKKN